MKESGERPREGGRREKRGERGGGRETEGEGVGSTAVYWPVERRGRNRSVEVYPWSRASLIILFPCTIIVGDNWRSPLSRVYRVPNSCPLAFLP